MSHEIDFNLSLSLKLLSYSYLAGCLTAHSAC